MAARRALSRLKTAAQSPDTTNGSTRCRAAASSLLHTQVGKKVQGESRRLGKGHWATSVWGESARRGRSPGPSGRAPPQAGLGLFRPLEHPGATAGGCAARRGPVLLRHPDWLLLAESDRLEFSRTTCGRDERLRETPLCRGPAALTLRRGHMKKGRCARLTGASAAGESPAEGRRLATTFTPSHGPTSARMEVKR